MNRLRIRRNWSFNIHTRIIQEIPGDVGLHADVIPLAWVQIPPWELKKIRDQIGFAGTKKRRLKKL
mgnify:CR=1 FL=1